MSMETKHTTEIFDQFYTLGVCIPTLFANARKLHGYPDVWVMHSSVVLWLMRKLLVIDRHYEESWFMGIPIKWDDKQPWNMTIEQIVLVSLGSPRRSSEFCQTMCHLDYVI